MAGGIDEKGGDEMKIGRILKLRRSILNQGVRELSKQIGISSATLSRIENGKDIDGKTMLKIIVWLMRK